MARGINKVILVGNLGNDPDTKYTQAGMAITRVSLATTSMRKDRDGNNQERTEWHRVVFFGKLGEIAGEYLRKGSQVYVEGELRYDKYTGQDGVESTAPTSSPTRCRCSAAVAKAAVVGWAAIARSVRRRVSRAAVAGRVVADMAAVAVAVVRTTRRVVSSRPSSSRRRQWTISQTTISRFEDCPSLCHPRGPALRGPSALWR